jgi:DNA-binding NarL/FixJ family response regulator
MIRVLLVDDHQPVRAGLQSLLTTVADIQVVGEATDGDEAIGVASDTDPEVVLMDLCMPGMSGLETTRVPHERMPEVQVVILTSCDDQQVMLEAIDAGAVGYLLKDADPQDVVRGVRAAANGESPISGKVAHALMTRGTSAADLLTPREREVLSLVAEGMSNRAIALRLDITEGTVKAHLTNVYQRIGVLDRTEAARWARRNGLAGKLA